MVSNTLIHTEVFSAVQGKVCVFVLETNYCIVFMVGHLYLIAEVMAEPCEHRVLQDCSFLEIKAQQRINRGSPSG